MSNLFRCNHRRLFRQSVSVPNFNFHKNSAASAITFTCSNKNTSPTIPKQQIYSSSIYSSSYFNNYNGNCSRSYSLQRISSFSTGSSDSNSNSRPNAINNNTHKEGETPNNDDSIWSSEKVNAYVGHSFPDFIEFWNRSTYRKIGIGLTSFTALINGVTILPLLETSLVPTTIIEYFTLSSFLPAVILNATTIGYWIIGQNDIQQNQHAIRRNYPILGNVRYILETIRPEIRQYLVESDTDGRPFGRMHRAQIYTRAKNVDDTIAFGTRRNLYDTNTDFACHSMWPKHSMKTSNDARVRIGNPNYGTTKKYSASIFNISAMSYGAISDHAILALNGGAKLGQFYHNTGEGGVSQFHKRPGGDLVYNIGTGYYGCGTFSSGDGDHNKRIFDECCFQETMDESNGQVKMIEIKLSQGAKPGHGGLLPKSKITPEIADARKLAYPPIHDCHSPSSHSAFSNCYELLAFIAKLRDLSGGLPVGIKLCIGQPHDFANLCKAIVEVGVGPDFITVDGAEGGTGAAPPEFSDSVGLPLEEGLVLARDFLVGANLKDQIKLIASGRITSGFSVTRNLALGADITNSARGFMMSLGCIQALKCNSNKCPTGIATQDKDLMYGLDPQIKSVRVYNYQNKTVKSALDIMGAMGCETLDDLTSDMIMRRVRSNEVLKLSQHFPMVDPGCLLDNSAPTRLQSVWDQ